MGPQVGDCTWETGAAALAEAQPMLHTKFKEHSVAKETAELRSEFNAVQHSESGQGTALWQRSRPMLST